MSILKFVRKRHKEIFFALTLAFVGTKTYEILTNPGVKNLSQRQEKTQKYMDQLLMRENIPKLEKIILEEYSFFLKHQAKNENPPREWVAEKIMENESIQLFENQIRPEIYAILDIPKLKQEPKIVHGPLQAFFYLMPLSDKLGMVILPFLPVYVWWSAKDRFKKTKNPKHIRRGRRNAFFATLLSCFAINSWYTDLNTTNAYNLSNQTICVNHTENFSNPQQLGIVVGHEYIHNLQKQYWADGIFTPMLAEGLARSIEVDLAKKLTLQTGNDNYSYWSVLNEIGELKAVYLYLCDKQGVKPSSKIEEIPVSKKIKSLFSLDPHATGIAVVRIGEVNCGKKLYKDLLKGDDSCLIPKPYEGSNHYWEE